MADSYVPSEGPVDARIVFVGEAPGKNEELEKRPFVGASGNMLRTSLMQNGLLPEKVLITNVCHYRPPGNNIAKFITLKSRKGVTEFTKATIKDPRIIEGVKELYADLARTKPNIVVPLGNVALWALTGLTRINKRRGSLLKVTWDEARNETLNPDDDVEFMRNIETVVGSITKVYPTFHPAYILRQMHLLGVFDYDISQIAVESRTSTLDVPNPDLIINPGPAETERLTGDLLSSKLISYDIEVIGGDTLFCVGFACEEGWALTLTPDEPYRADAIRVLLESEVPKLAQNGIFDKTWLARFTDYTVNGERHDTMVAQSILYPDYPKGLDFIGSLYTRFPYHKDEGKNWNPRDAADIQRFLEYNAKDVVVTLAAYNNMQKDELRDPLHQATYRRVLGHQPVYERMMVEGITIDVPRMKELKSKYLREAKTEQVMLDAAVATELTKAILASTDSKRTEMLASFKEAFENGRGTVKGGLNVNSPKQVMHWLYDIRGLPVKTPRGSSKRTANETALKELYAETKDESLLRIWKVREKRKRASSFLSIKTDHNNKTHFSVTPTKTKTGRSAFGKTILDEGLNMQTQPHELRDIFIPDDPAFEFAYLDLGQAEARVVAYAGGISRMIRAFENNTDLHRLTASLILGIPFDDVEEYPHRFLGKKCNHAFNYEMGPYKFHDVVNDDATDTGISVTRTEAKKLRAAHLRAYPELRFYWDWIKNQIKRDRTLVNPLGRKRVFYGRMGADLFREAYSHYAQSTVADVLKTGMVKVADFLTTVDHRARVVLEVHDAVLIQYPKEARHHVIPTCRNLMEIPITVRGEEITIPTDAQYGPNWLDLEKYRYASTPS